MRDIILASDLEKIAFRRTVDTRNIRSLQQGAWREIAERYRKPTGEPDEVTAALKLIGGVHQR